MADNDVQTNTSESSGSEEFSWRNLPSGEEFANGMAEFARGQSGEESDSDLGEHMRAEDYINAGDESEGEAEVESKPSAPQVKNAPKTPEDMQSLMLAMQQQQLQMFQEMQQQIAQSQSQQVAMAVQAALSQMGLGKQEAAPQEEIDPIAALDPDDPDYFFKKTDAHIAKLEKQNRQLMERIENERNQQVQAVQAQEEMRAKQAFVNSVNGDLGRAVDYIFQGWPDSPQVNALKQMAANTVDSEWYAHGYKPEGYTQGIKKAQEMLKNMESLKHTFVPKAKTPSPIGRGGNPPSSTVDQSGLTWRQMLDSTRRNDASALREAIKNGLH